MPIKIAKNQIPVRHAAPAVPAAGRSRVPSAGAVVFGTLGWVAAAAVLGGLTYVLVRGRLEPAKITARYEVERAKIQEGVKEREAEIAGLREELKGAIDAEVDAQTKLLQVTTALEALIREQEPVRAEKQQEAERLEAAAKAAGENVALYGEGVAELRAKAAVLQRRRDEMVKDYTARYKAMEAVYTQKMQDRNPELRRQFFQKHQHTPFGPGALFHTAERFYESKRSVDAERLYTQLLAKYADCGYVSYAQQRLAEIKARVPYEPLQGVGLIPYKALQVTQAGAAAAGGAP